MMRKLDRRGAAALEFVLTFLPVLTLIFVIFDLGRYAITMQSLRALANAGARAVIINNCFTPDLMNQTSPSGACCTGDPLPTGKQNWAPFLYLEGLTPTLTVTCATKSLTVTAQFPANQFKMLMPIWGGLGTPVASTSIPTF
jgi:hypothetical protein